MKKKTWTNPELYIIATTDISAKYINGFHEHAFTSKATPKGHALYNNTPAHSLFATGLTKTVHQYLS